MLRLFLLSLFILLNANAFAANFRTSFYVGQDNPDDGEAREDSANLFRFGISTEPAMFRLNASFSYLTGSEFTQGEFAIGPHFYPLAGQGKSRIQPFLYAEGLVGFGSFNEEARQDAGYDLGAGLDWRWGKQSGLSLAVALHSGEESGHRLYLGWFWQ